jgi:YVTN family beta-propeller protein
VAVLTLPTALLLGVPAMTARSSLPGPAQASTARAEAVGPLVRAAGSGPPGPGVVIGTWPNVSSPQGIVLDPATNDLFVSDASTNNVTILDAATNTTRAIVAVGGAYSSPFGEVFDAALGTVFVADAFSNNITPVNTTTFATGTSIAAGASPFEMALDPGSGNLWVADNGQNFSSEIYPSNGTLAGSVAVGPGAFGVAADPARHQMYFTLALTDGVSVVNASTRAVLKQIPIPGASNYSTTYPEGIAFDAKTGDLYVADTTNDTLSVIDPATQSIVSTIPTGAMPGQVLVDPANGYLYVSDQGASAVSVVNPANGSDFATIPVGDAPFAMAFDPANDRVYVGNQLSNNLSVIQTSGLPPVLTGVTIAPAAATLAVNGSVNLSASPVCSEGPCAAGTSYSWSTSGPLGQLNVTTGAQVTFRAGGVAGRASVFVNATLAGTTVAGGPALLTIETSGTPPQLTAVVIAPGSVTLGTNGTQAFAATPVCSPGYCPAEPSFQWSLSNSLGSLAPTVGPFTNFSAGGTNGSVALVVQASLGGITVRSAPVTITLVSPIPPPRPYLAQLTVTPNASDVVVGHAVVLAVSVSCAGGPCPSGVSVAWTLNRSAGALFPSNGSSTTFTAGGSTGAVTVIARATLDGRTLEGYATLFVVSGPAVPPSGTVASSSPLLDASLGGLAIAIVVIAVLALLLVRSRRSR